MKKLLKAAVSGAMLLLMAGALTACGKTEIDVMEGLELNYNGVDGYGTASIADSYVWEDAAMEAAGFDEDKMTDDNIGEMFRGMAAIEEAVSYEVYPNENLSNGDEVTVKATVDNESVEEYKIQFTGSEKKFIVEGLQELEEVDLFDGLTVEFEGFAPYVTATVNKQNVRSDISVSYSLDKQENLTVGDTVTVMAEYDEDSLLQKGYIVKESTKEFTVDACDRYVTQMSEIPAEIIEKMNKQFEDAMRAHVASSWSDKEGLKSIEYIGNYLLTPKEGIDTNEKNIYYGIYKITAVNAENAEENITYYSYCRFRNIVILKDGTCSVDLTDYKVPEGSAFSKKIYSGEIFWVGNYYYMGYEELDSLFNNCVTKNIEQYEYESTVEE